MDTPALPYVFQIFHNRIPICENIYLINILPLENLKKY